MKTKAEVADLLDYIFGMDLTSTYGYTIDQMHDEINSLRAAGQAEYTNGENSFGNFERLASMLNLDRKSILFVYAAKHLDGIVSYLNGHKSQREDVRGRINDVIVYFILLRAMIDDEEGV